MLSVNTCAISVCWTSRNETGAVIKLSRSEQRSIFLGRKARLGRKIEPLRCSSLPTRIARQAAPVLILTRNSAIGHLSAKTVAQSPPQSEKFPDDKPLRSQPSQCDHSLAGTSRQASRRLERSSMQEVCVALRFSLGCVCAAVTPHAEFNFLPPQQPPQPTQPPRVTPMLFRLREVSTCKRQQ